MLALLLSHTSQLLAPERVERMAKEMQAYYRDRIRAMRSRAEEVPIELQELGARVERLRGRLKQGDPDMPADEIQAAIDRADAKRRNLEGQRPFGVGRATQIQSALPRAAEMYRRQLGEGLNGNASAATKAREVLRELLGGRIDLKPEGARGVMGGVRLAALSGTPSRRLFVVAGGLLRAL